MNRGDFNSGRRALALLTGFAAALTAAAFFFSACSGQLQKFVDEDSVMVLTTVSNTTSSPTYSVKNSTLSFTVTIKADRAGSYSVLHGTDCSATRQPAGVAVTGSLQKDTATTISVAVAFTDVSTYGSKVVFCVADTANYKSASTLVDFSSSMTYFNTLNEQTGNGLVADAASAFQVFQANATSSSVNRGGTANNNTASRPYQHIVFVDPNDNYKMKYFVADRENHRVLIFNTLPTSNTAAADVVVGQTNFTNVTQNAGGTTSNQGFNNPTYVSVTNAGKMLVVDRGNHRVLIFNTIPTSNGTTANLVIGQPDMIQASANNTNLVFAARLNDVNAVQVVNGKVYIADRNNHRILVFNSVPTSDGASADFVIGQPDLSTFNSGTDYSNSSFLNHPYEISISGTRLYLADADNNRVLVFDPVPTASNERPDFVIGQSGPTGNATNQGGGAAANTLNFPVSVGVYSGRLVVSDQNNHRLLFYALPISANNSAATHVLGQANMTSSAAGSPATATNYNFPKSIIFDSGYIWVADQYNHRIQVMQLPF